MSVVTELLSHSGSLNGGEEAELARRRRMAPTITHPPQPEKESSPMAVNKVAQRALEVAKTYGPEVLAQVKAQLATSTANRAQAVEDVPKYVGSDPKRLSVAVQALARAGVDPRHVLPDDLVGNDQMLLSIRAQAQAFLNNAVTRFNANADKSLGENNAAADVLRAKRVQAALETFGSKERYFLALPNGGGIGLDDFVWDAAMRRHYTGR